MEDVRDMRKKESIMKKARMLATSSDSWRILGTWMFDVRPENILGQPGRNGGVLDPSFAVE